jgi:hypothetical protein
MPFSETNAIRLDLCYGQMKTESWELESRGNNYYSYESYSGQTNKIYSVTADFVFGNFSPSTKFSLYGLVGLGVIYNSETDYRDAAIYYYNNDTSGWSRTYSGDNSITLNLAIGGGLHFNVTGRLGIYGEAQYNVVSFESYNLFTNNGYFPLRAGLTYMFY